MAQKKQRNRAAEAAAMFEVTSMSSEEISALPVEQKENFVENLIDEKVEAELEKAHNDEIAEAKELGIEDSVIIESTNREISKDFESKLEEAQTRYLEAIDDKKKAEKQIEKLNRTIVSLSSQIDLLKTDTSREIANYKVEISDLNEAVSIYKANEINYKAEINALKADLATLETSLNEANKIINAKNPQMRTQLQSSIPANKTIPMFSKKSNPHLPTNGYDSWN